MVKIETNGVQSQNELTKYLLVINKIDSTKASRKWSRTSPYPKNSTSAQSKN